MKTFLGIYLIMAMMVLGFLRTDAVKSLSQEESLGGKIKIAVVSSLCVLLAPMTIGVIVGVEIGK